MKVELIQQPDEANEAAVKQYIADCVSVVRNKKPKNNDRLFDRLMKESAGNRPSRVLEFVPCNTDIVPLFNSLKTGDTCELNGFVDHKNELYYTNAREIINWGLDCGFDKYLSFDRALDCVDFENYAAVRVTAPRFVYNQLQTHTKITSVCFSARYGDNDLGYFKPYEVDMINEKWNKVVASSAPDPLKITMKFHGVKRKEIYNRGADSLQYVVFTLGGYTNSSSGWQHFKKQRVDDPHTQKETRQVAKMICDEIGV